MDVERRDKARGVAHRYGQRSGDRSDRREDFGGFDRQAVAEHRTVGESGRMDPFRIDGVAILQLADDASDKPDIVFGDPLESARAASGVPGSENPMPIAIGVHDNEVASVPEFVQ